MASLRKILFHVGCACTLLTAVATCVQIGERMGEQERRAFHLVSAPPLATLTTRQINLMTLGHRGLFDDFATIWAIQFLGDRNITKLATADEVHDALMSILRHKPHIEALYLESCYTLGFDFNRPEFCEEITRLGLEAFPKSWRLPMSQGFIETFKLKNNLKAATYYGLASSRKESPPYVIHLAKRLAEKVAITPDDIAQTEQMLKDLPGGNNVIEMLKQSSAQQLQEDHP